MGFNYQGFGLFIGLLAWTLPVKALEVTINPENPQLGDTVSVIMETNSEEEKPKVSWGEQTYPVFSIGENQYRTLIPTTPLDNSGRIPLTIEGETTTRNLAVWLRDRNFPTQHIRLAGGGVSATEVELERIAEFKEIVSPEKHWNGAFMRPSSGSVSTVFGVRRYYNGRFAENYYHRGVDYAAPTGSPIIAPADGEVVLVGRENEGFRVHGNTIGVDHGQGILSIFLHLHEINVNDGDFVTAGQQIGTVGTTGTSTGPHLHWGLYVNGKSVDPVPWRSGEIQ
ncbi:M23 family metallopeptidase [Euhalothece natronophila Z-M001]|uniref:M23 family metallopeptidase n=1 Tax=Euhalothece natronophila Z-M001 TaxID=522448 RepID=A0A5B8NKA9_9CHRO|nr:M23 family metallopeptidase [Euhalothece natronophila]QDZ39763.1 M23 family metallopeptidase [Euhalothece natronophila Z-M001]